MWCNVLGPKLTSILKGNVNFMCGNFWGKLVLPELNIEDEFCSITSKNIQMFWKVQIHPKLPACPILFSTVGAAAAGQADVAAAGLAAAKSVFFFKLKNVLDCLKCQKQTSFLAPSPFSPSPSLARCLSLWNAEIPFVNVVLLVLALDVP